MTVEQGLFEDNTASGNGGAVYVYSQALGNGTWAPNELANFTGCTFRNNTARDVNGGAVYHQGSEGANYESLVVSNCSFVGNNASSGGALCPWSTAYVEIDQCVFEQNTAYYGRGGALYTYGESILSIAMSA